MSSLKLEHANYCKRKASIPYVRMRHADAACGMRHAACGMRHAACGMRHAACGMRHAGCGMRHAACGMRQQMTTVGTHGSDSICADAAAVCGADTDEAN